jgi:hypothetical protein
MNEHDFQNLRFLLLSPPEVLADWYKTVDEDDHEYAMEILQAACLSDVIEILNEKEQLMEDLDLSQAQNYLSKFTIRNVQ